MNEPRPAGKEFELSKEMQDRLKVAVKSVAAPPHLESRIRAAVRQSGTRRGRYPQLMALAAGIAICLGTVISYELGHLRFTAASQDSYIASVTNRVASIMRVGLRDHIHCAVFRKFPRNAPALKELGPEYRELESVMTEAVQAPYRLVLAHQCRYQKRRFVHLAMKSGSSLISVVITEKKHGESFRIEQLAPALERNGMPVYEAGAQRFQIAAFETSAHLVYVISDSSREKNTQMLLAMAPRIATVLQRVEG
jgi:hypothetical protein